MIIKNCPICKADLQNFNGEIDKHLLVLKGVDNAIHVHGPVEDKYLMKELVNEILVHSGLSDNFKEVISTIKNRKEIVFHNRQRIGDILMFTAGIRDFKKAFPDVRVNVISTAGHIWDNNPYIDRALIPTEENTLKIGPGKLTNASNRLDWHFANAYRVSIEDALGIHIPQTESRPDIWFTQEEYNAPRVIDKPYWVIVISGEKGWGSKMYPFERWQEFVNQNKDTTFVQLGAREDDPPRLQGENIIDYVGKTQDKLTGIRDLFKLFLNAEGSIGLVSFHMHLSGALQKPCIVVAGAREPVSFTRYQGQQYLSTEGCLPCAATTACWHCDISKCSDIIIDESKAHEKDRIVPRCVDLIYPQDLTKALNMYYVGGRLKKGIVSKNSAFKNIIKESKPIVVSKPVVNTISEIPVEIKKVNNDSFSNDEKQFKFRTQFGYKFTSWSIDYRDWAFIENMIDKYNVKTVLEFGAGLSTLLFAKKGVKVVSIETDKKWLESVKEINPVCDIRFWDGKSPIDFKGEKFDMAFVDGPTGGEHREFSTKIASENANIILIHDATETHAIEWQSKYLKGIFNGPAKGGHWNMIYLWNRFNVEAKVDIYPPVLDSIGKITIGSEKVSIKEIAETHITFLKPQHIKFVFNGRGEGGAESSVTWMINKLVELGHNVTYHTPNPQPCGTFRKYGNKDVLVKDCKTLYEACDILVLYSNDWIWNFDKDEICDIFSNINVGRKVFCVNYRIDKIGLIEWTKSWNSYLFLNSNLEKVLLERCPEAKTKVMAPPTDLTKYFEITPDYTNGLRLIRHSSQGDSKYPKNFNEIIEKILAVRNDVSIRLMPAPSFIGNFDSRIFIHQRNIPSISEFLKLGNCFWYMLPEKYTEGGPKVVMEAQASGLPIIADNHSGMKDRVIEGTGWLCNSIKEYLSIIKNITPSDLEQYGKNAREHARVEYDPMNWIKNILGE